MRLVLNVALFGAIALGTDALIYINVRPSHPSHPPLIQPARTKEAVVADDPPYVMSPEAASNLSENEHRVLARLSHLLYNDQMRLAERLMLNKHYNVVPMCESFHAYDILMGFWMAGDAKAVHEMPDCAFYPNVWPYVDIDGILNASRRDDVIPGRVNLHMRMKGKGPAQWVIVVTHDGWLRSYAERNSDAQALGMPLH